MPQQCQLTWTIHPGSRRQRKSHQNLETANLWPRQLPLATQTNTAPHMTQQDHRQNRIPGSPTSPPPGVRAGPGTATSSGGDAANPCLPCRGRSARLCPGRWRAGSALPPTNPAAARDVDHRQGLERSCRRHRRCEDGPRPRAAPPDAEAPGVPDGKPRPVTSAHPTIPHLSINVSRPGRLSAVRAGQPTRKEDSAERAAKRAGRCPCPGRRRVRPACRAALRASPARRALDGP